jgi:glutathione S-transferase
MIRVWGRRSSVNVQKVLWTLAELDIPFVRETVGGSFGGNRDADFLRMNPSGLIPVILDGDVTMFESNAIVRYLAARYRAGLCA